MSRVGIPHVVDGMEESVATDLGAAAGSVANVITDHRNVACRPCEVDRSVVVTIASGRPGG